MNHNSVDHPHDRVNSQYLGLSGVIGFFTAYLLASKYSIAPERLPLFYSSLTALPMLLLSLFVNKTHRRESSGLCFNQPAQLCWKRILVKTIGFYGTIVTALFLYWLFPIYSKPFYIPFYHNVLPLIPWLLGIGFLYIRFIDPKMSQPQDSLYHAGLFFAGQWKELNREKTQEHFKASLIKAFFLPLMIGFSVENLTILSTEGISFHRFETFYSSFFSLFLTFDVIFGVVGYLFAFRILDTHIRSSEPTLLGWIVALCCYPPFSTMIWTHYFYYRGEHEWGFYFYGKPILFITWGTIILFLNFIYAWSTISFGLRFSNLTNRGIIRSGPYRHFKHPAYLAKNIMWWMLSVPFLSHADLSGKIQGCLLLMATNLIYYYRAKTEEKHLELSKDSNDHV